MPHHNPLQPKKKRSQISDLNNKQASRRGVIFVSLEVKSQERGGT
jgi:hypothetical protein